jgi:hypothetical protein
LLFQERQGEVSADTSTVLGRKCLYAGKCLQSEENIIDGRLNAEYHDLEESGHQETSPRRLAVARSQAIKEIASSFLAKHLSHLASEFEASVCIDVLYVVFFQRFIRE